MGRALIFLDQYSIAIQNKIKSLDLLTDSFLILCVDESVYLAYRDTAYPVFFLPELLSKEDVENTDRECLNFIKETFYPDEKEKDLFLYKGVRMGYVIEFYLIPRFMKIFRDILLVLKAVEHFEHDRIIVAGPEEFPRTARMAFCERKLTFESWLGKKQNMPVRLLRRISKFLLAVRNLWKARPAADPLIEPIMNLLLLLESFFWGRFKKRGQKEAPFKKWFFFIPDRNTLEIYKQMAGKPGWGFVRCGVFLGRRKNPLKEITPLEGIVSPVMTIPALNDFLHFLRSWIKFNRHKHFRNGFEFMGVNYWQLVKGFLKYKIIFDMPRQFFNYQLAKKAFKSYPHGILLVYADQPPYSRALVLAARQSNVKSMVLQHGIQAGINGHQAIDADFYAGWGQRTIDWFKKSGEQGTAEKVYITGAPRYDHFAGKKSLNREEILKRLELPQDKKIILAFTEWMQGFSTSSTWMQDIWLVEAVINAELLIAGNCHVVIKPHPAGDADTLRAVIEKMSSRNVSLIEGHLEDLMFIADLCVSAYSSCILEAMFFEKPSVVFDHSGYFEWVPYVSMGAALGAKNQEEMAKAMEDLLFDPLRRAEIIAGQKRFIEYAAYKTDGRSAKRVAMLIDRM